MFSDYFALNHIYFIFAISALVQKVYVRFPSLLIYGILFSVHKKINEIARIEAKTFHERFGSMPIWESFWIFHSIYTPGTENCILI